jgi:hypothetical protein
VDLAPSAIPPEFALDNPPPATVAEAAGLLATNLPRMPEQQALLEPHRAELAALGESPNAEVDPQIHFLVEGSRRALNAMARNWGDRTPPQRWEIFREALVLERVKEAIHRPDALTGSLRQIKQDIDRDIRRATIILSSIPLLSLIVASIGVANLMTVNLAARARQIAILRAVGSTKSQITRLVLVEALVLGFLGSTLGVLLGLHSAAAVNVVMRSHIGLDVPWSVPWLRVGGAVAVTWLICLLAGLGPALRASRSNIISALQTT